jgi:molybdopterin molybdotransferase
MTMMSRAISACCSEHSDSVSVEIARARALQGVTAIQGDDPVPLHQSRGRIAAADVVARHAVPPFNQSAMDGYAVRTQDFSAPVTNLPVVGRHAAGLTRATERMTSPSALRIFTGAPVPPEFDAVVMQENCEVADNSVTMSSRPKSGENIRLLGEDVPVGATILESGTEIDARHVALLASAGVPTVLVKRKVRVAIVSTGNELREPHESLAFGEIHDCNRSMLLSLLDNPAVEVSHLGTVADCRETIAERFLVASREFDIVLSTGGMSVGEEDHVRSSVIAAGGTLGPLKASIKPGKPVSVGQLGDAMLVGLPGNPVSALVTFLWFARPIVMRRAGADPKEPRPIASVADFEELRRPGRDEFVPINVSGQDDCGRMILGKPRPRGSARLSSLLATDGLARFPGHLTAVTRGTPLEFYPFTGPFHL